jgi:hypothetical protein
LESQTEEGRGVLIRNLLIKKTRSDLLIFTAKIIANLKSNKGQLAFLKTRDLIFRHRAEINEPVKGNSAGENGFK